MNDSIKQQISDAFERGDYVTLHGLYESYVDDYPNLQRGMADLYFNGLGVSKDFEKAFDLYLKAAIRGDIPAQFNVGNAYSLGKGVSRDFEKAFDWWKQAADKGLAQAQFSVGICYYIGRVRAKDLMKAKQWLEKSAAQGFKEAEKALRVNNF